MALIGLPGRAAPGAHLLGRCHAAARHPETMKRGRVRAFSEQAVGLLRRKSKVDKSLRLRDSLPR
jgi:hypothetical protein